MPLVERLLGWLLGLELDWPAIDAHIARECAHFEAELLAAEARGCTCSSGVVPCARCETGSLGIR